MSVHTGMERSDMTWEQDLEQLLRNQMPYAFSVNGAKGVCQKGEFSEALGYVLENVRIQMKKAFFEGYACGSEDCLIDMSAVRGRDEKIEMGFDKSLSRVGAERAYNKWEER